MSSPRIFVAILFVLAITAGAAAFADDTAMGQAQAASEQPSTSALTNERASGEAATTFDGTSPPAATPDASAGVDLQPRPFSAEPNQ